MLVVLLFTADLHFQARYTYISGPVQRIYTSVVTRRTPSARAFGVAQARQDKVTKTPIKT